MNTQYNKERTLKKYITDMILRTKITGRTPLKQSHQLCKGNLMRFFFSVLYMKTEKNRLNPISFTFGASMV